jgi:hypothetical protein
VVRGAEEGRWETLDIGHMDAGTGETGSGVLEGDKKALSFEVGLSKKTTRTGFRKRSCVGGSCPYSLPFPATQLRHHSFPDLALKRT